jgi:hypothetical protein
VATGKLVDLSHALLLLPMNLERRCGLSLALCADHVNNTRQACNLPRSRIESEIQFPRG